MTTDVQMLNSSGLPAFAGISLPMRAHNNTCSDLSNPINFQFRTYMPLGISVNEIWATLTGTSVVGNYPWAFATSNRPLSIIIHDPLSDQCMFCCDLRYLGGQACTKPRSPCNGNCVTWAIGSVLIGSFVMTTAFANYLKSKNSVTVDDASADDLKSAESSGAQDDESKMHDNDHGPGHHHGGSEHTGGVQNARSAQKLGVAASEVNAHVATPSLTEVKPTVRAGRTEPALAADASLNGAQTSSTGGAGEAAHMEDDVMAALDSIKELELLGKINDLEHELLSVEIGTKSGRAERASLATN